MRFIWEHCHLKSSLIRFQSSSIEHCLAFVEILVTIPFMRYFVVFNVVCDDTECHLKSAALQQISEENVQVRINIFMIHMKQNIMDILSLFH